MVSIRFYVAPRRLIDYLRRDPDSVPRNACASTADALWCAMQHVWTGLLDAKTCLPDERPRGRYWLHSSHSVNSGNSVRWLHVSLHARRQHIQNPTTDAQYQSIRNGLTSHDVPTAIVDDVLAGKHIDEDRLTPLSFEQGSAVQTPETEVSIAKAAPALATKLSTSFNLCTRATSICLRLTSTRRTDARDVKSLSSLAYASTVR